MNGGESGTKKKKNGIESNLIESDLSTARNYLFVFVRRKECER